MHMLAVLMKQIRTDGPKVSVQRRIAAPPEVIFSVLTDPSRHAEIGGSNKLRHRSAGGGVAPPKLELHSTFTMSVRNGIRYTVTNQVLEFEQDRLIAWAHNGGHRWRYELTPQEDGSTLVRESFDWSMSRRPRFVEFFGRHRSCVPAMKETLERLSALVERTADDGENSSI